MQSILFLLQAEFVTWRAGANGVAAAETVALIADQRLNSRQQLGSSHQAHRHARALEHRFDDLAVVVPRNNHSILHCVAAHYAAGGNAQAKDRVVRGGELVDQFSRGHATVESAGIALFEDDEATALDTRVAGIHRGGDEVGETHVGDEAATLLHIEDGFFALLPFGDIDTPGEHTGLHADKRQRLGKGKSAVPLLAVFTGAGRHAARHVFRVLLRRPALMNGAQRQPGGQAARRGAAIHPRQFESDQCKGEILRTFDVATLLGVHECRSDAGAVEFLQHRRFFFRPFVGVSRPPGHKAGHRSAGYSSSGLHDHLQVQPFGKSPHDLANIVSRERTQEFSLLAASHCSHGKLL